MTDALIQLLLFSAKTFIIVLFIVVVLLIFFALLAKSKEKVKGRLTIKNMNEKFAETKETLLQEILPKKRFKEFLKSRKSELKAKEKEDKKNVFVLHFHGDIKASAVAGLREEVTAILNIATPNDEVLVCVESGGGVVHGYGLAASQLKRFREHNIPLTISIDKIAASGGYMMACIGNKVLAAPFAIIGSIGVIVQLPNFNQVLKDKHIAFEQLTAGEYKRTLTMFGENTPEGRKKLQEEIEDIYGLFKNLILENRPQVDMQQVATGEHWLGQQALTLKLVDELKTSDEYLFELSKSANLFELAYEVKKPLLSKLTATAGKIYENLNQLRFVR